MSPVQCAVYLPEPANVERDKTNGRLLRIVFNALQNKIRHFVFPIRKKHVYTYMLLVRESNHTYYVDYNVMISIAEQTDIVFWQ